MDVFAAQDRARRSSWGMVALFLLAVAGVLGFIHLLVASLDWWAATPETQRPFLASLTDPDILRVTLPIPGGLIAVVSLFTVIRLSLGGGAAVARAMGGRLVERATEDDAERRLINVVEEISIASGVPVPPVYVLDREGSINAFAAGFAAHQAVVAVTRGALERLDRDELQGVVAHEFSHILNGDMRLNIHMAGLVAGILALFTIGRWTLYLASRSESKEAVPVALVGLALLAIGSVGWVMGEMVKAAVCRHREFLADAAAAQFTRHPAGLAGALRKIAGIGSQVRHPGASSYSHFFFGKALSGLFDSHPPVKDRLRRLGAEEEAPSPALETARKVIADLPAELVAATSSPDGARALVLAMLSVENGGGYVGPLAAEGAAVAKSQRVPLIDLALPALKEMTVAQRQSFLAEVNNLVMSDGKVTAFERAAGRLLHGALLPKRQKRQRIGAKDEATDAPTRALLAQSMGAPAPAA